MSDAGTIFKVWQKQGLGYVSLPRKLINHEAPKRPGNQPGAWEEHNFQWPLEKDKIKEYIVESDRLGYDSYWCPTVLQSKQRVKASIPTVSVLYADLDNVSPDKIPNNLTPSVLWESSPGRYAAVWFLERALEAKEAEQINKSLTYFLGADKGGWDLTQVLRIPGTKNHKYPSAPRGKLIHYNENSINLSEVPLLPIEHTPDETFEEEAFLDTSPERLLTLISSVKNKIKPYTLSLLISSEDDILLSDRSEKLWEIECQLLEQGISPSKVLELVACSNWNKYRGRKDEVKRLKTEIDKALTHTAKAPHQSGSYSSPSQKVWTSYYDLMSMQMDSPGWMIEGVWQQTSHGIIAGEPKTYKSVIATDMAVSVASGKPFLGKYRVANPGPVLYIQEENSPWLVKDRVTKVAHTRGALNGSATMMGKILQVNMPEDLPLYFLNNKGFDFNNEEDRLFLEETLKEIRPVLVIFDPLYLMLGGKDENSSKDIRPVLNWLLYLRYEYKTSVIVLHHWNKSGKSERGGQRMLGSVLFHGWVESAIYTRIVNEQNHQIEIEREFRSFTKPNNLQVTFNFGPPGDLYYSATIANTGTKISGDQVLSLIEEAGRVTIDDITSGLGIKQREARIRLGGLIKEGKIKEQNGIYSYVKEE